MPQVDGQPHVFQFTPVMRRATRIGIEEFLIKKVSIHARHATGDLNNQKDKLAPLSFNSRPSCDGRPRGQRVDIHLMSFNSRPSCDGRPDN